MRIVCDRCGKEVETITTWRNEGKRRSIVEVECHGEKDTMTLDDQDLVNMDPVTSMELDRGSIVGHAFTGRLIGQ